MQTTYPSISSIYEDLDLKKFAIDVLIAWPLITPSIEEVDRLMRKFSHKLKGSQRVEFEDNCLERINELLEEEKISEFHRTYNYEMHCVMNTGCQLNKLNKN